MNGVGPDGPADSGPESSAGDTRLWELRRGLRRGELLVTALLLVQYVIGVVVNLFVTIPGHHSGTNAAEYFGGVGASVAWALSDGGVWLAVHTSLGLLLVLAGIALAAMAVRARRHITLCVLGAVFILGAGFNGGSFLVYNEDFSSMIMAGLWALAMACYVGCLCLSGPRPGRKAR